MTSFERSREILNEKRVILKLITLTFALVFSIYLIIIILNYYDNNNKISSKKINRILLGNDSNTKNAYIKDYSWLGN